MLKVKFTDRGHLSPVIDFNEEKILKEVNVYTNIAPQHYILNRGLWRDLEIYQFS